MSRINVPLRPPSIPGTVALGDLAIAAGFAGRCVTLCYPDYPRPCCVNSGCIMPDISPGSGYYNSIASATCKHSRSLFPT